MILLLLPTFVSAQVDLFRPVELTLQASKVDRRWVALEYPAKRGKSRVVDLDTGKPVRIQYDDREGIVRWLVKHVPAGKTKKYVIQMGRDPERYGVVFKEVKGKYISIAGSGGEITRYYFGPPHGGMHDKPFFYPWNVQGVNVARSFPIEDRKGESKDHKHHMSIYHTHGDVNGKDYWHKAPIKHKRVVKRESGLLSARLVVEHAWGTALTERQDVRIYDVGKDALGDWTVTLTANEPVEFGKTKEGGFAIRVTSGLTRKNVKMVDAKGNKGEPAIRKDRAPWVDYSGTVDGKKVGVALMNHPGSFRHPTTWHVRAYGCFSANPFFVVGKHKLAKGESITLRFRLYGHGGNASEGKVAAVYAGYTEAKLTLP